MENSIFALFSSIQYHMIIEKLNRQFNVETTLRTHIQTWFFTHTGNVMMSGSLKTLQLYLHEIVYDPQLLKNSNVLWN